MVTLLNKCSETLERKKRQINKSHILILIKHVFAYTITLQSKPATSL